MNITPVIIAAGLALLAAAPFGLSRSVANADSATKTPQSSAPVSLSAHTPKDHTGISQRQSRNPSGLPIPRFAVLEADETWGRIGPSFDYPVRYEFNRKSLPVKIIGETKDNEWRQVEDHEGARMWIHRAKLASRNTAMINLPDGAVLRIQPVKGGQARAHLEYGVLAQYENCTRTWCEIIVRNYRGYVLTEALWGIEAG